MSLLTSKLTGYLRISYVYRSHGRRGRMVQQKFVRITHEHIASSQSVGANAAISNINILIRNESHVYIYSVRLYMSRFMLQFMFRIAPHRHYSDLVKHPESICGNMCVRYINILVL